MAFEICVCVFVPRLCPGWEAEWVMFQEILYRQWKTGECNKITVEVVVEKGKAAYSGTNPTIIIIIIIITI